jgi:hypothetical protein
MDMLLGGAAFAAIIFGQFAAVVVVHGERKYREAESFAPPRRDQSREVETRTRRQKANLI